LGLKKYIDRIKFRTGIAKCSDYADLAQDVLDDRASKEEEIYLKRHFNICLKCLDKLNLNKELKKALQHKISNQELPAGLADSIKNKIAKS